MNRILLTIEDVRKQRQLSLQKNSVDFDARVLEVQRNGLTDLLGRALFYDFFNYLDNNWTEQVGTLTRDSDYQFTIAGVDLSSWVGCALRINDQVYNIVKTAIYGGSDTIITVEGYKLPDTLTTIEYKTENDYIKLLNGSDYDYCSKTVRYEGLRPFLSWQLLAILTMDDNVKHADTGSMSITGLNFKEPNKGDKNAARKNYLSNATREENNIIDFLSENNDIFTLWEDKRKSNTQSFNFNIV